VAENKEQPQKEEKKENPELLLEVTKSRQILYGLILIVFGYFTSFLPAAELRQMVFGGDEEVVIGRCMGNITITNPENYSEVSDNYVDVTGTVEPVGDCRYVALTVKTMVGSRYTVVTDNVTIDPIHGVWETRADLSHILVGQSARIQAHLCMDSDIYQLGCLKNPNPEGVIHSVEINVKRIQ
jgi:hypothetical protein